ncbi:30S ribosomal protein S6e [Candidatus Woesearchaeota archaeon]|nr:30S ribosomal protein S6e [Candidatus Woesearchaeota archaeon]
MPGLNLVIGDKDGKSYSKKLEDHSVLVGRKIGEQLKGEIIGISGYEFKITGGSNDAGFPMRHELNLTGKKIIYARKGVGIKTRYKGTYIRKTVAGNTVGQKTAQLNISVEKAGKKSLAEIFGKASAEQKEAKEEKGEGK